MRLPAVAVILLVGASVARGEPRDFRARLHADLAERLLAEADGTPDPGGTLLLLDALVLGERPRPGDPARLTQAMRRWMEGGDPGTPRPMGYASRYRSAANDLIVGDGRTLYTGDTIAEGGWQRDVQVKGKRTPLAPSIFGGDLAVTLPDALRGMVISLYLEAEGIPASRAFAIGRTAQGEIMVGRVGSFERFAHARELAENPTELRAFFDGINRTLGEGERRKGTLGWAGLFRKLLRMKATEQAALFWARVAHGAPTYDNIGFFGVLDLEQASTVASNDVGYTPTGRGPGYGNEGPFILGRMYQGELYELMTRAARGPEELQALRANKSPEDAAAYWEATTQSYYFGAMETRLLHHMGLDPDLARSIHQRAKAQVRTFLGVFLALANERATTGDRPRYDLFAGLSTLFRLYARQAADPTNQALHAELIEELRRTLGGDAGEHAEAFYDAALPIMEAALADVRSNVRIARARVFADEAERVNAPVDGLLRERIVALTEEWSAALERGEDPEVVLARIYRHVRSQVRHGPYAPGPVAQRLRRQQVRRTRDGRMVLAVHGDPFFAVEELSDGTTESLRVRFRPRRGSASQLTVSEPGGEVLGTAAPRPSRDGSLVFEWPMAKGAPRRLRLAVDGDGAADALELEPVAASPLVDGELGVLAERAGTPRPAWKTPRLRTQAMKNLGTRRPNGQPLPPIRIRFEAARAIARP